MTAAPFPHRLYICFVVMLVAITPAAAATPARLTGEVIDPAGGVVAGAVVLLHERAGTHTLHAYTDLAGSYEIDDVAPGTYLLDASTATLVSPHAQTVVIQAGAEARSDIRVVVAAIDTDVPVTGAAAPQSVDRISKALDVVTAQPAEQRGLFLISDALRFVPGLRVSSRGGPGADTQIETRGLPRQDTAVLLDGSPLRDPTSPQDDASVFISQLLLVDTARVEVLRGPGSSLYGTNAVAGTINILTAGGAGPLHGDIDLQGGGLGLFEGSARLAGAADHDRLSYSLGAAHLNETRGVDNAGAARDWSLQAGLQYAIQSGLHATAEIFGSTGYAQQSTMPAALATGTGIVAARPVSEPQLPLAGASLPYPVGNATFLPSLGDPDAGTYSHFLERLFRLDQEVTPKLSYRASYSLLTTDRNNTNGPAGPSTELNLQPAFNESNRFDGRVDTLNARVDYLFGSHNAITANYEWTREEYLNVATDRNPVLSDRIYYRTQAEQRFQSAYVQDQLRLLNDRLEVLVSGRWTGIGLNSPAFAGGLSPYLGVKLGSLPQLVTGDGSLAYLVAATSTKLRAHTGKSFRLPALYERFGGYSDASAYLASGDPRLRPERAIAVDFGFDQYLLQERVRVSGTYFYSHLQQVINYVAFPPTFLDPYGLTGGYRNTGGGLSRGLEFTGEVRPARHATITASYVYTDARDRTSRFHSGTGVEPLQVPGSVPHAVKMVATQSLGRRVDVALDLNAASSFLFPLDGRSLAASNAYRFPGPRQLGLAAGYSMRVGEREQVRFYTRVSNALGQNFYEEGFRTPGRWAVAGVHFSF